MTAFNDQLHGKVQDKGNEKFCCSELNKDKAYALGTALFARESIHLRSSVSKYEYVYASLAVS
jgi:hypothetical protein